jgi:group II intron reverse transcriptase/maturase
MKSWAQRDTGLRHYASKASITEPEGESTSLVKHILINKKEKSHINDKLIHIIADPKTLTLGYELIKSNPGNMTKRGTNETLDGMSNQWILETSAKLKAGKFNFSNMRRVNIKKADGSMRPLTISSPRDKVVQKAIQLVLEPIYEPIFFDNSHGFRPNKGCHTALKQLRSRFHGITWLIETDIHNCYDTINQRTLLNIIGKKVKCVKTLTLIKKGLECGVINLKAFSKTKLGTPQGSILSPLLCNIYLHELDEELYKMKGEYSSPQNYKRRKNPEYRKLQYELEKANKANANSIEKRSILIKKRKLHSKDPFDPNFRKLFYIRYADDIVIGVTGSYKDAETVLNKVRHFLDTVLELKLKKQKTSIVNFKKKQIEFLGTTIYGISRIEKPCRTVKHKNWKTSIKQRITPRVGLHAPIKKLLEKLLENGFCRKSKEGIYSPTAVKRIVNFDHADILSYYNRVIRGILNYYSFADNYTRLGALVKLQLLRSCALTLALKYKIRYKSKAFKKFGSNLACPKTGKIINIPESFKRTGTFNIGAKSIDSVIAQRWNRKLTKSNLGKSCVICGTFPAEMHHIRKIEDLRLKQRDGKIDFFTMQMIAINRKQVPLCSEHHKKLHQNKLSQAEVIAYSEGVQSLRSKKT